MFPCGMHNVLHTCNVTLVVIVNHVYVTSAVLKNTNYWVKSKEQGVKRGRNIITEAS